MVSINGEGGGCPSPPPGLGAPGWPEPKVRGQLSSSSWEKLHLSPNLQFPFLQKVQTGGLVVTLLAGLPGGL